MLNETNGILAGEDWANYVMKRIYFESDLDNQFFRKDSDFESYRVPYIGRIEVKNIPVFSFRYKNTFSKSEEEEFETNFDEEYAAV